MSATLLKGIPGWTFERRRHKSFEFLPDPHEYHLEGDRLWSPSMVFERVGYTDYAHLSRADKQDALYRGSYVHRATHLVDEGDPEIWKKIHHEYLGFVEAYCEFTQVWRWRPRLREVPIYHPDLLYGTTPDGEGIILDGDAAIVEIKTGSMIWWTAIQTAAHDMAIAAWDGRKLERRRFGVELKENGKFRVQEFDDPDDHHTWQSNLKTVKRHHREPPAKLTEAWA